MHAQRTLERAVAANDAETVARLAEPFLKIAVRRDDLLESSLSAFRRLSPALMTKPLRVRYEGEDGIDAGGPSPLAPARTPPRSPHPNPLPTPHPNIRCPRSATRSCTCSRRAAP